MTNQQSSSSTPRCKKCEHFIFEHQTDGDRMCKSCNCWSFEQVGLPSTINDVSPTTTTAAENDEQKFAPYSAAAVEDQQLNEQNLEPLFADARKKIDGLEHSKSEIIKKLAQDLEAVGHRVEDIAHEIVLRLEGRVSAAYVRRNLDEKYKDQHQSANAKKQAQQQGRDQKVAIQVSPTKRGSESSPEPSTGGQSVDVDDHETTDQRINPNDLPKNYVESPSPRPENPVSPQLLETQELAGGHGLYQSESTSEEVGDLPEGVKPQPQPQPVQQQQSQSPRFKVLINSDEFDEKMAEFHHKDVKHFWLGGRIENGKLLDITLERATSTGDGLA